MIGMRTRVENDGITAESVMIDPPATAWDDQRNPANWYRVTLTLDGRTMTVPFGMGSALTGDPTPEDVINCLVSDAGGYYNSRGFEDWASEYGYDTDSRRAYGIYEQITEQTAYLSQFLGDKLNAYLYETEGL